MDTHFAFPEVLVPLIKFSDRATWEKLYPTYRTILENPRVIRMLQDYHQLTGNFKSFADFLYDYDLHDPFYRSKLCTSLDQMKQYAVEKEDFELFKELLDNNPRLDVETLRLIGQHANPLFLEYLKDVRFKAPRIRIYLGMGLVEGKHFQLLKDEYLSCAALRYLSRDGHFNLVKEFYGPACNSQILDGAAETNQLEIIDWILQKEGIIPEDYSYLIYGALRGGNLTLVEEYKDMAGPLDETMLIISAVESDDPRVIKWLVARSKDTEILRRNILLRAAMSHKNQIIKDLILKFPQLLSYGFDLAAKFGNLEILKWIFKNYKMFEDQDIMVVLSKRDNVNRCAAQFLKSELKDRKLASLINLLDYDT